jgi:2-methylcitrate dehydratase PrpD
MNVSATRQLAEFVENTPFERLPPEVVRGTKRAILNYLGVAIGASRHEVTRILTADALAMGGHPQATILGSGTRATALQAARVNGAMSHVFDYDDTHMDTIIHPTGPVMSAALALAEWKGLGGRELIAGVAVGAEVELRVGLAVYPAHYDVGWHITGTAGTFGAAAGAGRMMNLDAGRISHALGLAGTQAAGIREMFGSMAKSLHVGNAAANGLWSALLAERGFTASTEVLEGRRGFCAVTASEYDLSRATDGLGERYIFLENSLKPYACGVVTHPTIDGVRRLRERHSLKAAEVREIETRVHPLVLELTGKKTPRTGLEGKFSIYYCAAIALVEGNARESQFTGENTRRPEVVELRDRVRVVVEPGLSESQAVVIVRTVDGRELVERVEAATGTPDNPMPDHELVDKFMDLVLPVLPRERAEQLVDAVGGLEGLEASRLASLSAPE